MTKKEVYTNLRNLANALALLPDDVDILEARNVIFTGNGIHIKEGIFDLEAVNEIRMEVSADGTAHYEAKLGYDTTVTECDSPEEQEELWGYQEGPGVRAIYHRQPDGGWAGYDLAPEEETEDD